MFVTERPSVIDMDSQPLREITILALWSNSALLYPDYKHSWKLPQKGTYTPQIGPLVRTKRGLNRGENRTPTIPPAKSQ